MVNAPPLLLIQHDLEKLAAVLLGAGPLADDFDGIDQVGEDGLVHSGERAAARALLGLRGARAVRALRSGQDAAHGQEEDLAVGELLLELARQAVRAKAEASAWEF